MSSSPRQPGLPFIFFTVLLDVLGFGILIPVAPLLVQGLLNGGAGGTEQEAAGVYGWLIAMYAAMQFVFSPILGALSDRFGRRPVLLVSLFGSGLDYFAMALAPTLWVLFLTRAINGISGASITVCTAYVADITPHEKRAGAFGMIGAAFGLGFVIGPAVGGVLGKIDIHLPFYVAGGLTLLNWLYGLLILPESLPKERRAPFSLARANPVGSYANLTRYPLVAGLASAWFLLNMAQFGLHATWVLYTAHRYNWNPAQVGLSLTVVGLGAAVVQGGLARRLIPRLGEPRSMLIGIGIGVCAYIAYGLATEGWMIYAIVAVASLGGIAQPAMQATVSRTVSPTEQGAVQGSLTSLANLAQIAGPVIATTVFAWSISGRLPVSVPGMSFFVSAALAAGVLGVTAMALRRAGGPGAPSSPSPPPSPTRPPATSA
ncbi:MAG: TCR/Tet family MFS transporter [Phycisphaerales bacterium]|nr:TCR/Tet family MFS transporter [Phycisphaerales bacterium]